MPKSLRLVTLPFLCVALGCALAPKRSPRRVHADTVTVAPAYTECVAVSLPHLSSNRWNVGEVPDLTRLRGWTPVGGTAIDREAGVVLCR